MTFIKEPLETGAFTVGSRVSFVFSLGAGAGTIQEVDVDSPFPFRIDWDDNDENGWYPAVLLRLIERDPE